MALIYEGNSRAGVPINKRIVLFFTLIVAEAKVFVNLYDS